MPRSQNFLAERNLSLTIACPACHAPTNAVCTRKEFGSRVEVENYAAHWQRLNEARRNRIATREAKPE